jgi:hypothetical protein
MAWRGGRRRAQRPHGGLHETDRVQVRERMADETPEGCHLYANRTNVSHGHITLASNP